MNVFGRFLRPRARSDEPVQYSLRDLKLATKNFSDRNRIGKGGFGVVYKGLIDGQIVAVKKLHGSPVDLLGDVAQEVRLLSSLKNDILVKFLGFCAEAGHYLLVYEYLSNGDLRSWLTDETKRHALDWEKRFKIIEGIVKGLSYLHNCSENAIIHMDLKPENILLDEDYNAKVTDFGLSKIFDTDRSQITIKKLAGTLEYIAPELWFEQRYSCKSDVFSCGLLILEVLAGSTISRYAQANEKTLSHVVWEQWKKKKPLEIIDSSVRGKCPQEKIVRFILIGLLCVQHDRKKRPKMKLVLEMLNTNDHLPEPSFPGYLQDNQVNIPKPNDPHGKKAGQYDANISTPNVVQEKLNFENRQFSYKDLEKITKYFQNNIGAGGFGGVYAGILENGTHVAVKIRSQSSSQGIKEFLAEAQNLTRVHHKNLVSLIGYCINGGCMALVYEYMQEGTLQDKLLDNVRPLTWKHRLRIAYESALGLEYLHKACNPPLIHRDVKTSNILLNVNLEAKIADFGLSGAFNSDASSHVSTAVVGTPGYLDPEYYSSYQLSEKSDVFSFGVVLLEIITGRPPVIAGPEGGHVAKWARQNLLRGDIESIVDERMRGQYDINSVWMVTALAFQCTEHSSAKRPAMNVVVAELKESLDLEISTEGTIAEAQLL